jgi:1-acyl-sn-glycerol-3-phosphate acyltransferase
VLYTILKPLGAALLRVLFRLEWRGREHVPRTGPVLLVANHSSLLDPPLVAAGTPRPVTFLAKAELFRIPLFGGVIRRLNAYPVRREGPDPGALRTALRALAEGRALLVFPEGTRGEEGRLRPAKSGAGMLALMSGAPVVPVYVSGSGRAWPKDRWLPRLRKVTVTFGPPLRFAAGDGSGRKDSYEAASREMMAAIGWLQDSGNPTESGAVPPPAAGPARNGGVGVGGARTSPKYTDWRSEQHGAGRNA